MADTNISQLSATDPSMEIGEEIDASIEADLNPDATQVDLMNIDGTNDMDPSSSNGMGGVAPALEARIPAKKDASLREFLSKMDDYAPIVCRPRLQCLPLLSILGFD